MLLRAPADLNLQIRMAVSMGMRIGEIMSLEWSQINFSSQTIYLPRQKLKLEKKEVLVLVQCVLSC